VVNDQTTTLAISLDPQEERPSVTASSGGYTAPPVLAGRQQVQSQKIRETPARKSQKTEKAASQKEYSSLRLKSNVESPKLVAGGQILGVGNLTYKKLKPGKHRVEVTKDGYKKWKGTVNLKPDKTYVLDVTLERLQQEPAKPTYSAEDFYQSGLAMLTEGNTASAIEDFTEAINLKPSMADAYANRARAYQIAGSASSAENDYVRAGEIFASQKRYETAHQMFSGALDVNKKSIPALINMAGFYKNQNDDDKAIKTYKEILKYDKNNFRANFELGKLYFSMHKNKWADKYLRNAHDADPNIPEVYHYLMLNYFARDDFKKVKKTYADFKLSVSEDKLEQFKDNPRFEPIIRIVGEYERP
jgi:tetratricopeptide (TPR) repeat protein